MLKRKIFAFFVVISQAFILFGTTVSHGQVPIDGCDAVLEIAARETIRAYDYNEITKKYYDTICAASSESTSGSAGGNLIVPTKYGLVGLGFTQAKSRDALQTRCAYRSYFGHELNVHKEYLSLVNPLAIQAWSQCKQNKSGNAKISANQVGDTLMVNILPIIVGTKSKASLRILRNHSFIK